MTTFSSTTTTTTACRVGSSEEAYEDHGEGQQKRGVYQQGLGTIPVHMMRNRLPPGWDIRVGRERKISGAKLLEIRNQHRDRASSITSTYTRSKGSGSSPRLK